MLGIDERALRIAWTVFLLALLLVVIYYIRETLLTFAGAIFLAYMLSPIVSLIEEFIPKRRTIALAIVYCMLIGLLVLLGFKLIPVAVGQATNLLTHLPSLVSGGGIAKLHLPTWLEPVRAEVIDVMDQAATGLQSKAVPFLQKAGTTILTGLGNLLPIILVPIFAFFFLKDARAMRDALLSTTEDGHDRTTLSNILADIHEVLRSYMRTLVLLAISAFIAWSIFLSAMRYPYELLLAAIAAILEFIPVVGPAVALVIMSLVVLVTGTGGLLWIVIFWASFRLVQDYVINPYLMSSGVEMHPLLVLFGVLAGEKIGGIAGMFFSVPTMAILRAVYGRLREKHTRRQLTPG
ncbi:MAG TPA: AI-2E family transporter [Bryobacteraceae bacterium]|jgi:predicted PurR-regulated permease PerM|nr:AI-2E family transporter [Bryobacteraceae bacterium]